MLSEMWFGALANEMCCRVARGSEMPNDVAEVCKRRPGLSCARLLCLIQDGGTDVGELMGRCAGGYSGVEVV